MTYSQKVEKQAKEIIRVMKPALKRKHGKYPTEWGNKTEAGLAAAIFNVLVAVDLEAKSDSWKGGEGHHV